MPQRQYKSFDAAIKYLEANGTPKFWGWVGQIDGYYLYSFTDKEGDKYLLEVYADGLVKIKG